MAKIKIGYAPTRRSIFSAPDAVKYRGLTADRLRELGIDFVDITDVNEEGLLYDEAGRIKIAEKFKKEKIDGLFLPHCNFGTEFECARLAKELNVPVLLVFLSCKIFFFITYPDILFAFLCSSSIGLFQLYSNKK